MKKRLISALLIGTLTIGMATACGKEKYTWEPDEVKDPMEVNPDIQVISGMDDFNTQLIDFIDEGDYGNKNYMISPTSLKAALCLATAGANGETKKELLEALNFQNDAQMNNWYALVYNATVEFDKSLQAEAENLKETGYTDETPDGAFRIVNSIWANEDSNCKFKKEYIDKVAKDYSAKAESVPAGKLTDAVNSWVDKSTNGQISKLSEDLSQVDLILANVLYLRSGWLESFEKANTEEGDFKTINGDTVTKEYMSQVEKFGYYEDSWGKLVVIPMKYGVNAVFVLGKISDIDKALSEVTYVDVDVKLPKMDMESEFGSDELIGFIKKRGAVLAVRSDGTADFSLMSDSSVFIDEIIQKTRIKTDEEGLEASAVTAIMMTESAALVTEQPEVKEFHAEEPFQFMIYTPLENGENEILFYGHMVE